MFVYVNWYLKYNFTFHHIILVNSNNYNSNNNNFKNNNNEFNNQDDDQLTKIKINY